MTSKQPPMQAPPASVLSSWNLIADPEEGRTPLAQGWEVRQDPTTGAIYYYNPETHVMSKSRPEDAQENENSEVMVSRRMDSKRRMSSKSTGFIKRMQTTRTE